MNEGKQQGVQLEDNLCSLAVNPVFVILRNSICTRCAYSVDGRYRGSREPPWKRRVEHVKQN